MRNESASRSEERVFLHVPRRYAPVLLRFLGLSGATPGVVAAGGTLTLSTSSSTASAMDAVDGTDTFSNSRLTSGAISRKLATKLDREQD